MKTLTMRVDDSIYQIIKAATILNKVKLFER